MNLGKNHSIRRDLNLECGDASPLFRDATCRVGLKRGHVRAVQRLRGILRGNFCNY